MRVINYDALWSKIGEYAKRMGRWSVRPVILMWYVMLSKDTPKADKMLIMSAISYLVLPIDLIPGKRLPIIGMLDEIVSLTVAYGEVCKYITPEMEAKADAILDRWFPKYTSFETVLEP